MRSYSASFSRGEPLHGPRRIERDFGAVGDLDDVLPPGDSSRLTNSPTTWPPPVKRNTSAAAVRIATGQIAKTTIVMRTGFINSLVPTAAETTGKEH